RYLTRAWLASTGCLAVYDWTAKDTGVGVLGNAPLYEQEQCRETLVVSGVSPRSRDSTVEDQACAGVVHHDMSRGRAVKQLCFAAALVSMYIDSGDGGCGAVRAAVGPVGRGARGSEEDDVGADPTLRVGQKPRQLTQAGLRA